MRKNLAAWRICSFALAASLFCSGCGASSAMSRAVSNLFLTDQTDSDGKTAQVTDTKKEDSPFYEDVTFLPERLELKADFDESGHLKQVYPETEGTTLGTIVVLTETKDDRLVRCLLDLSSGYNYKGEYEPYTFAMLQCDYQILENDKADEGWSYTKGYSSGSCAALAEGEIHIVQMSDCVVILDQRIDNFNEDSPSYNESLRVGGPFEPENAFRMNRNAHCSSISGDDIKSFEFRKSDNGNTNHFHVGFEKVGYLPGQGDVEIYTEDEFCQKANKAIQVYTDRVTVAPLTYDTRYTQVAMNLSEDAKVTSIRITPQPEKGIVVIERSGSVNTQVQNVAGSTNDATVRIADENGNYDWGDSSETAPETGQEKQDDRIDGYFVDDENQIVYSLNEGRNGYASKMYDFSTSYTDDEGVMIERNGDGTWKLSTIANVIPLGTITRQPNGDLSLDGQTLRAVPTWISDDLEGTWSSEDYELSMDDEGSWSVTWDHEKYFGFYAPLNNHEILFASNQGMRHANYTFKTFEYTQNGDTLTIDGMKFWYDGDYAD